MEYQLIPLLPSPLSEGFCALPAAMFTGGDICVAQHVLGVPGKAPACRTSNSVPLLTALREAYVPLTVNARVKSLLWGIGAACDG